MLLLDAAGTVFFVEPHLKLIGVFDAGPVQRIALVPQDELLARWSAEAAGAEAPTSSGEQQQQQQMMMMGTMVQKQKLLLNDALLLLSLEDHHAAAHISLMEIFRRTTLLRYYSRRKGDSNPKHGSEEQSTRKNEIVGGAGGGSKLLMSFLWHGSDAQGKSIHTETRTDVSAADGEGNGNHAQEQPTLDSLLGAYHHALPDGRAESVLGSIALRTPATRPGSRYVGVRNGVIVAAHDNLRVVAAKTSTSAQRGHMQPHDAPVGPWISGGADQSIICSRFSLSYYIFRGFYSDYLSATATGCADTGEEASAAVNEPKSGMGAVEAAWVDDSFLYVPKLALWVRKPSTDAAADVIVAPTAAATSVGQQSELVNSAVVMRTFVFKVFAAAVRRSSETAYFLSHLEFEVKKLTDSGSFHPAMPQYSCFTSFLYRFEPLLLTELMSRLGRKLEPSVSKKLFPVHLGCFQDVDLLQQQPQQQHHQQSHASASENETNMRRLSGHIGQHHLIYRSINAGVIALYESALQSCNLHHAARLLSLACESLGGSDSHISTVASLVLALELLHHCLLDISARNALECFDFCMRLESMIALHSDVIFGSRVSANQWRSSSSPQDMAYISSVKGRALVLIRKQRGLSTTTTSRSVSGRSHGTGAGRNGFADPNQQMLFSAMSSASPALPFYIGAGVAWVVSRAFSALTTAPTPAAAETTSALTNGVTRTGKSAARPPSTSTNGIASRTGVTPAALSNVGGDTGTHQNAITGRQRRRSTRPDAASALFGFAAAAHLGRNDKSYRYTAIDILEQECGIDELNGMLSYAKSSDDRAELSRDQIRSPTVQLLVHNLREFFRSSSHYCNVAVLMVSILLSSMRNDVCRQILIDFEEKERGGASTSLSRSTARASDTARGDAVDGASVTGESVNSSVADESSDALPAEERVRRIFFALRLTKSVARGENLTFRLYQSVSPQYLRRVIEADMMQTTASSSSSNSFSAVDMSSHTLEGHNSFVPVLRTARDVERIMASRSFYFELPEEVLRGTHIYPSDFIASPTHSSGVGAEAPKTAARPSITGRSTIRSADTGPLCIFSMLRALVVALLLVKEYDSAHLLLVTIAPCFASSHSDRRGESNEECIENGSRGKTATEAAGSNHFGDEIRRRLDTRPLKQWTAAEMRELLQRLQCM